jgi:hypothetical protein
MPFSANSHYALAVPIGVVDTGKVVADGTTKPSVPLGTIVNGVDPTLGEGEFIFLAGAASVITGTLCTYAGTTFAAIRATTVANQARPVAISMQAATAGQWGWFQIAGTAVVAKRPNVAVNPTVAIGVGCTGKVGNTAAGLEILGARSANTASVASTVATLTIVMNRPHLQGRIT